MAHSSLPMSLPHVSAIQATLQGPTPSIRYEAASENNDKRYEDRAGFEGFEVRSPVWERRSEARRVGCRVGYQWGQTHLPRRRLPPPLRVPPSLHRRNSQKRPRPCLSSRRSTAEVTISNPVQRVQRVQRCPCERRWAALHPHRTQSPGRGPPSAPGAWDSPARSLTSARSSLIVAQPRLMCTILHPATPTGSELIASLYAYRSIARALPTVSGSEANRKAIYTSSFEVQYLYALPS